MDRFAALRVFRRVIELNGFAAAARDLDLSNAAVSKIIKELEADLGVQLIQRTTRSLRLTDTGHDYFNQITRILDELEEADDAVRSSVSEPRGVLRISAPLSLGLVLLSQIFARFAARYPELELDVEFGDQPVDLIEGRFDLAVRGGLLQDSSLKARKLMDIERVVCASPGYLASFGTPERPEDLSKHRCLIYSLSASPRNWMLEKEGTVTRVAIEGGFRANNSLAVRDAAIEGLGIALVPKIYAVDALESGRLIRVLPEWGGELHALYGVYPQHREASLKVRFLLDFLVEAIEKALA
ncbi:LysR family transcriptional regulator [Wenzhouxiangella marina]|uniref:Transcriptional regulator n=1 Tax=Wenzhouxiangella marina TaxID=1579979 RepID=A0A0K0XUZ5_9GAMM|nr:LysR family transcriptional regulator [Wenzhouxiangella marina]AKS41503.1 transcriptional regulator [Wenzhouxiangella marina]MBB6086738.1 DNA-binding transcriptional LysR family regulator [Wenzhouxiangella marina]